MSTPFVGQIMTFAGSFAPEGWVMCDGSLLSISQFQALYSIVGTTYGGDGQNTFGVPDLRGRMIVGAGNGPGLGNFVLGQRAGATSVTLNQSQMPAHTHQLYGMGSQGTSASPAGDFSAVTPGSGGPPPTSYASPSDGTPVAMAGGAVGSVGGSTPVSTVSPYTCINHVIAWDGIYPTRS